MVAQRVACRLLDGAEVLAHHEGTGPLALQGDDGQQVVRGQPHVRAVGGSGVAGDPPQPEHPHHVVDAQPAVGGHRGADRLDERLVAGGAELPGDEGRQPPVLTGGVELVRRRADRDAVGEQVLPLPRVEPVGVDTDRQVLDEREAPGRLDELLLQEPLEPDVEPPPVLELGRRGAHRRGARVAQVLGPVAPAAAVLLDQCGPRAVAAQRVGLAVAPALELGVAPRDLPHLLEHAPLLPPRQVAFDAVGSVERTTGRDRRREPVDLRGPGDVLDAQVQRVPEATAGREVRAGLLGLHGSHRAQRVDEQEPGAELAGPARQAGQVAQVADAPARGGAGRVQLHRPPPGTLRRKVAASRCDDHLPLDALAVAVPVVAERQLRAAVGGHLEAASVLELQLAGRQADRVAPSQDHRIGRTLVVGLADDRTQGVDGRALDLPELTRRVLVAVLDPPLVRHPRLRSTAPAVLPHQIASPAPAVSLLAHRG